MTAAKVHVYRDLEHLSVEAAGICAERMRVVLRERELCVTGLAGGSTPKGCYRRLAVLLRQSPAEAARVRWFLADERWVTPDHPDSNEAMVWENLLAPAGLPRENLLSWQAGSGEPNDRAEAFGSRLDRLLEQGGGAADLLVLGLGKEGHTASLFPGAQAAAASTSRTRITPELSGSARAVFVPALERWRLTVTPGVLSGSRAIVFLVAGKAKREALSRVLAEDRQLPAAWLNLAQTIFLVTRDTLEDRLAGG